MAINWKKLEKKAKDKDKAHSISNLTAEATTYSDLMTKAARSGRTVSKDFANRASNIQDLYGKAVTENKKFIKKNYGNDTYKTLYDSYNAMKNSDARKYYSNSLNTAERESYDQSASKTRFDAWMDYLSSALGASAQGQMYNAAPTKTNQELLNASTNTEAKAIDRFKSGELDKETYLINQRKANLYNGLINNDDFKKNSKKEDKFAKKDRDYNYINSDKTQRELLQAQAVARNGNAASNALLFEQLTDNEVATYNYLYKTKGKKAAKSYLNALAGSERGTQALGAQETQFTEATTENPKTMEALRLVSQVPEGIGSIASIGADLIGNEVMRNRFMQPSVASGAIQREELNQIRDWSQGKPLSQSITVGKGENKKEFGNIYENAYKFLDSAARSAISGAALGGSAMAAFSSEAAGGRIAQSLIVAPISASAYGDDYYQARKEGLSDFDAKKRSFVNASIEWATEIMGGFFGKEFNGVIGQMNNEALEEITGDILNTGYNMLESAFYGRDNDLQIEYKELIDSGMTAKEAVKEMLKRHATEEAITYIGTALSMAPNVLGTQGVNEIKKAQFGNAILKGESQVTDLPTLVNVANALGEGNAYKILEEQVLSDKEPSARSVANLYEATMNDIQERFENAENVGELTSTMASVSEAIDNSNPDGHVDQLATDVARMYTNAVRLLASSMPKAEAQPETETTSVTESETKETKEAVEEATNRNNKTYFKVNTATNDGNPIVLTSVASVDDEKVVFNTALGTKVSLDDIKMTGKLREAVYDARTPYQVSNDTTAQLGAVGTSEYIKQAENLTGTAYDNFKNAAKEIYFIGATGSMSLESLLKNDTYAKMAQQIGVDAFKAMYKAGQIDSNISTGVKDKASGTDRSKNTKLKAKPEGKYTNETGDKGFDTLGKAISKALGIDLYLGGYTGQGNGRLFTTKGSVELFEGSKRGVAHALGHEAIGEVLRAYNRADYNAIVDTVLELAAEQSGAKSVSDMIQLYYKTYLESDKSTTLQDAREELANDLIATLVFGNEAGQKVFAEHLASKQDQSLAVKFREFIQKIIDTINRYLNREGLSKVERSMLETDKARAEALAKEIMQAWDKAADNIQNQLENKFDVDTTESGSAVRNSYDSWSKTDKNELKQLLIDAGHDGDAADRWIEEVNSIAGIILGNRAKLDYIADKHQLALKDNDEYLFTLDMSTLCKKRRLYQGTYNAIMKELKDSALLPEDTIRIRKMMAKRGYEVPCGICYEESRKKNEGKFANTWLNGETDKEYNARLKAYEKALKEYPKKLADYNKLKNKGKKKPPKKPTKPVRKMGYANESHTDSFVPTLADVTTTIGRAWLRETHPDTLESYLNYQKGRGSANPKVTLTHTDYRGEIRNITPANIAKLKHIGGLRLQSFSDFEIIHVIDMMQAVLDMSAMRLTSQAYTKVPAFADIFGGTGIKINLSLIGHVDENGVLQFDDKEGMPAKDAFRLRDKYSDNVGTIIVGANNESILAAWADNRIDMVIPFHRSGWSKAEFEALGLGNYEDFQAYQTERYLDGKSANGISLKDAGLEEIYSEDYWDFSKSGKENAEAYLRLCAEKRYRPVFYNFLVDNGDGTYSLQPDGSTDGYWKSLIDFKMYNNEGIGAPQQEVTPNFDMDVAKEYMLNFDENPNTLPVAKDVVKDFVKDYKKKNSLDVDYQQAVSDNDMDKAQELLDKYAMEWGAYSVDGKTPLKLYHGTPHAGFTELSLEALQEHDSQNRYFNMFLTDDLLTARSYSNGSGEQRLAAYNENVQQPESDRYKAYNELHEEYVEQFKNIVREVKDIVNRYVGDDSYLDDDFVETAYEDAVYYDYKTARGVIDQALDDLEWDYEDFYHSEGYDELVDEIEPLKEYLEAARVTILDWEANGLADQDAVYSVYAKVENPFVLDANGKNWDSLRIDKKTLANLPAYKDAERRLKSLINAMHDDWLDDDITYEDIVKGASVNIDIFNDDEEKTLLRGYFSGLRSTIKAAQNGEFEDPFPFAEYSSYNALDEVDDDIKLLRDIYDNNKTYKTRDITDIAQASGYDGVVFKNIKDDGGTGLPTGVAGNIVVPFSEQAIKSADTVTYDDEGKVIPLDERFDESTNDLRYSIDVDMDDTSDLIKQNEELQKTVDYLKIMVGRNTEHKVNRNSVHKAAVNLRKRWNTRMSSNDIAEKLTDLYDYIAKGDVVWEDVRDRGIAIAQEIIENEKTEIPPENKARLDTLKTFDISISEKQRDEIKYYYGNVSSWLNTVRKGIHYTTNGTPLDIAWQELSQEFPDLFEADANSQDQPMILADAINSLTDTSTLGDYYGMTDEQLAEYIMYEMYDEFFNIPEIKTPLDRADKKLAEERIANRARLEKIKRENKARLEKEVGGIKAKYKNKMQKQKDTRERSALRASIRKHLNKILTMAANPTKDKHIPNSIVEGVRSLAEAVTLDGTQQDARLTEKLNNFRNGFVDANIKEDSQYAIISDLYNQYITEKIDELNRNYANVPLKELPANALREIRDLIIMTGQSINNINRLFNKERNQTISSMAGEATKILVDQKKEKGYDGALKGFFYDNMKPVYFFEYLNNPVLMELYQDLRDGEDTWITLYGEAEDFKNKLRSSVGYNDWDMNETETFDTTGGELELSLQDKLAIYANSLGEHTGKNLIGGGFVFGREQKKFGKKRNDNSTHRLSADDVAKIVSTLSDEQIKYVREMIKFMSTTAAEWGNQVSRQLYGVELYKERTYYPAKIAKDFRKGQLEDKQVQATRQLVNSGFSKAVVPEVKLPVVLDAFDDVVMEHLVNMASYRAFVMPLENFQRVYNYVTVQPGDENTLAYDSVSSNLKNAFGTKADAYINHLLEDINGGAMASTDYTNKLISLFKKGAVFASASVVVQQPSAIGRALSIVNPKYFVGNPLQGFSKKNYEEMLKYNPIARIKELGYFDTGMARSAVESLNAKEYEGKEKIKAFFTDGSYRDDALSFFAAKADEVTWTHIWNACKNEARDKYPNRTEEEQKQKAAERFKEVITKTQVYDSVFSRAGTMRNKNTGMKMATAFMAEPLTNLNMLTNAIIQTKRGNMSKGVAAKTVGSLVLASTINALLQTIVTAARHGKDDDDWKELYLAELLPNMLDNLNPAKQIPILRDAINIFSGYDVTRTDMSVIEDVYKAVQNCWKDNVELKDKIMGLAGALANCFGLPLRNVYRDVNGVVNVAKDMFDDYHFNDENAKAKFKEELNSLSTLQILNNVFGVEVFPTEEKQADKLYNAMVEGKTEKADKIKSDMKEDGLDEKKVENEIRKNLKNEDDIIKAADSYNSGDMNSFVATVSSYTAKGFRENTVVSAIKSIANENEPKEKGLSEKSPYTWNDIYKSLDNNQSQAFDVMHRAYVDNKVANGKTTEEAEKSFKQSLNSHYKAEYFAEPDKQNIIKGTLTNTGLFTNEDFDKWKPKGESSKVNTYDEMNKAFEGGVGSTREYIADRIATKKKEGMKESSAIFGIKTSISNAYKKQYLNGDANTKARIITYMTNTGVYGDRNSVRRYIHDHWEK